MTRRRWRITVLAALATLAAVYPVTSLFTKADWLPEAMLVILVTAALGLLLRGLLRSRMLVTLLQLALVLYFVLLRFTSETFTLLVLPTPETVERVNALGLEALATVQRHSAPAPLTDGVTFYLVGAVALIAVLVDAMAATWRAPAAAGLPLLTAYLITASNGSTATAARYFVVPVVLWLVMLHTTARAHFGRWSTTAFNDASRGPSSSDDASALRALTGGAARLGAIAVVAALVIPALVPHLSTRYLLEGLGRGGGSNGEGTVGFNDTVDLRNSLTNTDKTPILRYTTTGPATTPLRVLATSFYSDGEWSSGLQGALGPARPVPLPPDPNRREYIMTVTGNVLKAPRLAAPYPVVSTSIPVSEGRIDPVTRELEVDRTVSSYEVTYAVPAPSPELLRAAGRPRSQDILDADTRLPGRDGALILAWSQQVTAGQRTDYDKAVAIQAHLRDSSRYTYSLDLGRQLRDDNGRALDPIEQFYRSRRGYCVQFATAMIMLARAQGIPARMAIGFLPGSREDSAYVVRASDAHAWPELYFQGAGWVRFEPTASRSGPPSYSLPAGQAPGPTATNTQTGPTSSASAIPTRRGLQDGQDVATAASTSWRDQLLTGRNLVLLVSLLVVTLGTFLMPLTAWLTRSRRRRRAATRQDLVEIEWAALTSHLGDLGLTTAPGATLRAARERYITDGHLDAEHATVMRRVTTTLERARYDRPERTTPRQTEELSRDIRSIRRQVSATRSWTTRLRSFLWPTEGVSVWRRLLSRLAALARRS